MPLPPLVDPAPPLTPARERVIQVRSVTKRYGNTKLKPIEPAPGRYVKALAQTRNI